MKKIIIIITSFLLLFFHTSFTWGWDNETEDIYTKEQENVIEVENMNDPLRDGTLKAVEQVGGIVSADVSDSESAKRNTIDYISKWINYFLALLAMITIIFIMKDGFVIVTAKGEDGPYKKAMKNVKNYIIAVIGIGVSYLIVNLIIYIVSTNTYT